MPLADHAQQTLKLIECEDGGRRIVYRLRQRLDGDVDDNPKRKGGILLHRALRPERNQSAQPMVAQRDGVAIHVE